MRKLALCVAAALAIYGFVKLSYPTHSWRQKITITVTTPEGEKTGSAVHAVAWSPNRIFKDGAAYHLALQGEAVAVEIAPGKVLFALLSGPSGSSSEYAGLIALYRFGLTPLGGHNFPWADADFAGVRAARRKGPADLPAELLPILVTFRDIADPKSVERVDPNNLPAAFGQGVTLKRATLEITDEPITTGIEKRLPPWFRELRRKGASLDGDTSVARMTNEISNVLGTGAFQRGTDQ